MKREYTYNQEEQKAGRWDAREAIKSQGRPTPLNAPIVKRRTRCDVCIQHLCGEARRHSTVLLKNKYATLHSKGDQET